MVDVVAITNNSVFEGPGRHIAKTSNGNLWIVYWDGTSTTTTSWRCVYSADNGATWNTPTNGTTSYTGFTGTAANHTPTSAIFIDEDDVLHMAYKDRVDGTIVYKYATPITGQTGWTWQIGGQCSAAGDANVNYPDVVAHRRVGASGTKVHVIWQRTASATTGFVRYSNFHIVTGNLFPDVGNIVISDALALATAGTCHATIDFNHTGNGKSVAGSAPDLYVSWNNQRTGTGYGIRYKRATHSAGTWTWGTEREIDSATITSATTDWQVCVFDGTRINIVVSAGSVKSYDRDAADTTTTSRTLLTTPATTEQLHNGSAGVDTSGNIYLVGRNADEAAGTYDLVRRQWTRSSNTLSAETVLDTGVGTMPWAECSKYVGTRVDYIWYDETATAGIDYTSLVLNVAPNAPTGLSPTGGASIDRTITNRFSWTFSDPDAGDSQSKYDLRYRLVGAGSWTDILNQTTTNQFHDFAGGTFAAGDYEWQVRTYDAAGAVGPYSASSFYTAASTPATPTITSPTLDQVISQNTHSVQWSAPTQASYQVRTVADNAGAPNTGTIYTDTGEVVSSTDRARTVSFAVTGRTEHVQVRVKASGLWSAWASVRVSISFTPPPIPTRTLTANNTNGTLSVAITNPAPGGGQPAVTHNDVYINDGSGEERKGTNVAANGTFIYRTPVSGRNYTSSVRVVAIGANGTSSSSS